jgi:hypothetical protein
MKNAKVAAAAAVIAIGGAIGLQSVQVQARDTPNYEGLYVSDSADVANCKWIMEGAFEGATTKAQGQTVCPPVPAVQ